MHAPTKSTNTHSFNKELLYLQISEVIRHDASLIVPLNTPVFKGCPGGCSLFMCQNCLSVGLNKRDELY